METNDIAIQYGVPLPETCKELNWQNETIFCYYKDKFNNMLHLTTLDKVKSLGLNFYAYAPQMHEIAKLLPKKIIYDKTDYFLDVTCKEDLSAFVLHYNSTLHHTSFQKAKPINIQNYHYTQAYAEMYLKLKSLNLLK